MTLHPVRHQPEHQSRAGRESARRGEPERSRPRGVLSGGIRPTTLEQGEGYKERRERTDCEAHTARSKIVLSVVVKNGEVTQTHMLHDPEEIMLTKIDPLKICLRLYAAYGKQSVPSRVHHLTRISDLKKIRTENCRKLVQFSIKISTITKLEGHFFHSI